MPSNSSNDSAMPIPANAYEEALERFVLFWGEMASSWGINRTMAQIHALLYALDQPLDTDEIMARLQVSRGNANMNLRALVDWNLVRRVHQSGSRKDYYTSEKDVWKICARVIQERNRREVTPVKQTLTDCLTLLETEVQDADAPNTTEAGQFAVRIRNLVDMIQLFENITTALLPFLGAKDMKTIQQLIELTASMRRTKNDA